MRTFSSRAASKPFITGMERSSTIRSGFNSWALSIPSRPFPASPHNSNSGIDAMRRVLLRGNRRQSKCAFALPRLTSRLGWTLRCPAQHRVYPVVMVKNPFSVIEFAGEMCRMGTKPSELFQGSPYSNDRESLFPARRRIVPPCATSI
jgi:hypothetical protein